MALEKNHSAERERSPQGPHASALGDVRSRFERARAEEFSFSLVPIFRECLFRAKSKGKSKTRELLGVAKKGGPTPARQAPQHSRALAQAKPVYMCVIFFCLADPLENWKI